MQYSICDITYLYRIIRNNHNAVKFADVTQQIIMLLSLTFMLKYFYLRIIFQVTFKQTPRDLFMCAGMLCRIAYNKLSEHFSYNHETSN